MTWTDERVELLRKLWADGNSCSQIAGELGGVTRDAVIGKVHRLGLSGRVRKASTPRPARAPSAQRTRTHGLVRPSPSTLPPRPAAAAIPDDDTPPPGAVEFGKLKPWHCRYPFGFSDFLYCGEPASVGSYCSHHHEKCHQPMPARGRKPDMGPQVKVNF